MEQLSEILSIKSGPVSKIILKIRSTTSQNGINPTKNSEYKNKILQNYKCQNTDDSSSGM